MDKEQARLVVLISRRADGIPVEGMTDDQVADEIKSLRQVVEERIRFDTAPRYSESTRGRAALERANAPNEPAPASPAPVPAVMPEGTTIPPETA